MTAETEERLRELENKNIEFEDEIQCLTEENITINAKNKELLEIINKLNTRLMELNRLIYDFSRDRPQEEVMKVNAQLIREVDKIKSDKMMVEAELHKLKEALEKLKIRPSRPEKKGLDYPNSPASFHFDEEDNEIFGESFVIDSNNKELEEKLRKVEEELQASQQMIDDKNKNIAELEEHIERLEAAPKPSELEGRKSESFEMMNNDNIRHIRDVLLKFLRNVPPSDKSNEALLDVVFDMLHMKHEEVRDIKESRNKLKGVETPNKKKKGGNIFSRMLT